MSYSSIGRVDFCERVHRQDCQSHASLGVGDRLVALYYNLKSHGTRGVLWHRPLDRGKTGSPCSPVQGDGLIGLDRGSGLRLTKRRARVSLAPLGPLSICSRKCHSCHVTASSAWIT